MGGDLSPAAGGGGIALERGEAQECFIRWEGAFFYHKFLPTGNLMACRCEEHPGCKWFTWDERAARCYLKSSRGYVRERWGNTSCTRAIAWVYIVANWELSNVQE